MIDELEQPGTTHLPMDCQFPEVRGVIEGSNPGWVFVDERKAPEAALVWAQGIDGFYLVGNAESPVFRDELDRFTYQVLEPRLRDLGVSCFEISGDQTWDPVIESVFTGRALDCSRQWVYTHKLVELTALKEPWQPDGCRLLGISSQLLDDPSINNKFFLSSKLNHFWGSVDRFLASGLGYVLVDQGAITSVCFSGFLVENDHAIHVETALSHRRKGYL